MQLTLLSLVLLQTVFHCSCIIFGKNSLDDEDTRFMVSLQAENPYSKHFCSGVFLRLDFVLTAASCMKNKKPQDLWIVAGVKQLSNNEEQLILKVDNIFKKDPSGHNNVRNNIALLHISTEIPDSERKKVREIDLAPDPDGVNVDETEEKSCKTYGWGAQRSGVNEASDILQVATKVMTHWKNCKQPYKNNVDKDYRPPNCSTLAYNNDVDESNICTSCVDKAQLCYFDAGDPLISEDYLLGISTENYLCDSTNNNDIYTRVQSHKDWIRTIIEPEDGSSSTKTPPMEISPSDGSSLNRHKSHVIIAGTVVILLLLLLLLVYRFGIAMKRF